MLYRYVYGNTNTAFSARLSVQRRLKRLAKMPENPNIIIMYICFGPTLLFSEITVFDILTLLVIFGDNNF